VRPIKILEVLTATIQYLALLHLQQEGAEGHQDLEQVTVQMVVQGAAHRCAQVLPAAQETLLAFLQVKATMGLQQALAQQVMAGAEVVQAVLDQQMQQALVALERHLLLAELLLLTLVAEVEELATLMAVLE
jgi:hypothetical protein